MPFFPYPTIAWQGSDGDNEIYYWDGNNTYKITDNHVHDFEPTLYNGIIAWHGSQGPDDRNYDIFYWDGSTIHNITLNPAGDISSSLHNRTIAWSSNLDGDFDIYYIEGIGIPEGKVPPIANAGNDQAIFDTVTFDGSASYDEDGYIVSYNWELVYRGDAAHDMSISGVNPTITDLYSGFYDVYLTVTDDEGITSTDTSVVAAAGPCRCTASTMYVASITAGTASGSKGRSYGQVIINVFDDFGKPVAGATVTGTFTVDFHEDASGVTDDNGIAVICTYY